MITKLYIDVETRSVLDLEKAGLVNYAKEAEILVATYSYGGTLHTIPFLYRNKETHSALSLLADLAQDETVLFVAHNASFERMLWRYVLTPVYCVPEVPLQRWRCTMAKALACGLPDSLGGASAALHCITTKDVEGRSVMLRMCKPLRFEDCEPVWEGSREMFDRLCEYNRNDVLAEAEIDQKLPDLSTYEQQIWFLDQKMNETGVLTDKTFSLRCCELKTKTEKIFNTKLKEMTGGSIDAFSRTAALLRYLKAHGYPYDSLDKFHVKKSLDEGSLSAHCYDILRLKQKLGRSSVAKYDQLVNLTDEHGILYFYQQYHGAGTGRWAGRGVQLQNLPVTDKSCDVEKTIKRIMSPEYRITEDTLSDLSNCVRGTFIAPEGKNLLSVDFSAIEARVVMWLAQAVLGMKMFHDSDRGIGLESYILMAQKIYRKKDIKKPSIERDVGKRAFLGFGFGMGAEKFMQTCEKYDIIISEQLAELAKKTYRETFPEVVQMWKDQERSAIKAVLNPGSEIACGFVTWKYENPFLTVRLPSQRKLYYYQPRVRNKEQGQELIFLGTEKGAQLFEESLYGGKIVENLVQAAARDIMIEAAIRVWKAGFILQFTVHDELVCVADEGRPVEEMVRIAEIVPKWAKGLEIRAEGRSGKRYGK